MIPCRELRIGNYVLDAEKLERICMINDKTSQAYVSFAGTEEKETGGGVTHALANIQPVPLTDDILKQCHFVYHPHFKFWQLITGEAPDRSEMDIDNDYNILDFMRKPVVKKIASLHQLQNIYFMLKGKELQVTEA